MRVLFLESFYGGSHRDVADSLVAFSQHAVSLETLPARFWKWRSRGASLEFARRVPDPSGYDLVMCSGLTSIADLRAVWRDSTPPILLYAHETQLSYPVPDGGSVDVNYGMTDISNIAAADYIAFNSATHRSCFLDQLPTFLRKLPDFRPMWIVEEIEQKSSVCYPGITVLSQSTVEAGSPPLTGGPHRPASEARKPSVPSTSPLVIWNHRWEFDKNPELFFGALTTLAAEGIDFRVAVLGENFQVQPGEFLTAREKLGERIVAFGYAPQKSDYLKWLQEGTVVVSTAIQENFGIAVLEAVAAGCFPVLPRRLSYPEIIPERFHDRCLYNSDTDLVSLLRHILTEPKARTAARELQSYALQFAWPARVPEFDILMEKVAAL